MTREPRRGSATFVAIILLVGLGVPILAVAGPSAPRSELTTCTPGPPPVAAVADSFVAVPMGSSPGEVWTYDSTSGEKLGSAIQVGYDPIAMAVDTKYSELFVLNQGISGHPASVSVINYQTGFSVNTQDNPSLPSGDVPTAIAVSPGGNHVVVANPNEHSVTTFDPQSFASVTTTVNGTAVPSQLAFSDSANYLYAGDTVNNVIDELTYNQNTKSYAYSNNSYGTYTPTVMATRNASTFNTLYVGDATDDEVHVFTMKTDGTLQYDRSWSLPLGAPVGLANPGLGLQLYVSYGGTQSGTGNPNNHFDEIATQTGSITLEETPHDDSIGALSVNADSTIISMASTATGGFNTDRWAVDQNQPQDAVTSLGGVPSALISVPSQALRYYAYVAQSGSINADHTGDVSVVDLLSDTDIADVKAGYDPQALVVSPDGSNVYVANAGNSYGAASLEVISTANIGTEQNPTATAVAGAGPFETGATLDAAALSPSGDQLLLADYHNGVVYDVDLRTTPATTSTITVGAQPVAIAMNPSGTYAYVANKGGASISVLETSSQDQPYQLYQTQSSGLSLAAPQGAAFSANGRRLYVSDTTGSTGYLRSYSVNPSSGAIVSLLSSKQLGSAAPGDVAVSPQGNNIYVALTNEGATNVLDGATLAVTSVTDSGTASQAVATTPDGGEFAVADSGSCGASAGALYVYATGQSTAAQITFPTSLGNTDPSAVAMSAGISAPAQMQAPSRDELAGGGVNPAEVATSTGLNDVRAGVDTATGSYSLNLPGLQVASPGLPLDFSLTYDSGHASDPSPIGNGWTFPYAMTIAPPASGNGCEYVVSQENGSVANFVDVINQSGGCTDPLSDFGPPGRVSATLERPSSTSWEGSSPCPPGTGNCLIFQRNGQNQYFFSTDGTGPYPLVGIQDIFGNTVTLSYGGGNACNNPQNLAMITAQGNGLSGNRALSLTWNCPQTGPDQIATVADNMTPTPRQAAFRYSASGELGMYTLSGGTDRLTGHSFEFGYDSNNELVNWWDPDNSDPGTFPTLPTATTTSTQITYTPFTNTNASCVLPGPYSAVTKVVYPEIAGQGTSGTATYDPTTEIDYGQYDFSCGSGAVVISDPNANPPPPQTLNVYDSNFTLDRYADGSLLSSTSGYGPNQAEVQTDNPGGQDGLFDQTTAITIYVRDPVTLATRLLVDPDGNTSSFEYNALGDLDSVTKPDGGITTMLYDPSNELTESTSTMTVSHVTTTRTTSYTYGNPYNSNGPPIYLTAITDPAGNPTRYLQAPDGSTCEALSPQSAADGNVLPTSCQSVPGPAGVTTTTFDSLGNAAFVTNPDADVTSYAYDADGEVCGVLSANGYAAGNRLSGSTTCPAATGGDYLTVYPYRDVFGDVLQKTTPHTSGSSGNVWLTYYDADGRRVAAMTPRADTSCDPTTDFDLHPYDLLRIRRRREPDLGQRRRAGHRGPGRDDIHLRRVGQPSLDGLPRRQRHWQQPGQLPHHLHLRHPRPARCNDPTSRRVELRPADDGALPVHDLRGTRPQRERDQLDHGAEQRQR